jgi:hypothetical protein
MAWRCNLILAAILAWSWSGARASEGGGSNYLPGFYGDFAMAVMPDQGTFLNNFFAAYRDGAGNTPGFVEMPGILHVTPYRFLGARYLVGLYPGLMGLLDRSGDDQHGRVGLGDFYVIPAALNWRWEKFAILAYEGIVAPTGRYQKGELNSGRNVWTFDHILSLSWTLPAGNELSVTLGYMNNLENSATHYRSGDEFHLDYLLGHYFRDDLALGIAGSVYQQVTSDRAGTSLTVAPDSEAATIGPTLMYTPHWGGRDVTLSLKWLHEFNVKGRPAGDYLVWRAFVEF